MDRVDDSGLVLISVMDIIDTLLPIDYLIKSRMKASNGPVVGSTNLEYIDGYKVTSSKCDMTLHHKFEWEKVNAS